LIKTSGQFCYFLQTTVVVVVAANRGRVEHHFDYSVWRIHVVYVVFVLNIDLVIDTVLKGPEFLRHPQ